MKWRKNLAWKIKFDNKALKELSKLDKPIQKEITKYLREKISAAEHPRRFGKALSENLSGLWRYN